MSKPDGKDMKIPILFFFIGSERVNIYRHPLFYVTEEVKAWYEEYSINEHTQKEPSDSINPLYIDAMRIYQKYKHETEKYVRDRG